MSFFKKVKDKMGIGGAGVRLHIPDHAKKSDDFISGAIFLTTKSEQEVVDITVKLVESRTTGRGEDKKTKKRTCGEIKLPGDFTITPGDAKEFSFDLPFQAGAEWKDLSGGEVEFKGMKTDLLKSVGKLASMASNETIEHHVNVVVDIKSAWRDPSDKQSIILLN